MAGGEVTNLVFVSSQNGKAVKLEEELRKLARSSRSEPGSLIYEVHQSASDRSEFFLYGIWRSQEDLEAHMKAGAIQEFLGSASELVDGALNFRLFAPIDVVRIRPRDSHSV